MEKVSAIIATYNAETTISRSIESALSQSHQHMEIVIVDDASTDKTVSIVGRYAKQFPQIVLVQHNRNRGPGAALNSGIRIASGEWIARLDADDTWERNRIAELTGYAKQNGWDGIYDDCRLVSASNPTQSFRLSSNANNLLRRHYGQELTPYIALSLYDTPIVPMVKREYLMKHAISYPETYYGEDVVFRVRLVLAGAHIGIYPGALYNYEIGRLGSLTTHNGLKLYAGIREWIALIRAELLESMFGADQEYQEFVDLLERINHHATRLYKLRAMAEVILPNGPIKQSVLECYQFVTGAWSSVRSKI